ncbi:glutathione S-transferase family protein [Aquisalimonas asiatica]|uniref:Glutathione S-transferase n=1 Tax=Aquisalimonas asiatica TaxID=406100 RepID=A0A1H8RTH1_9GAMM|nr:glutathione S-transferase N-terminal domain-containing protein [Aquisalimonas asiatica]SEO69642.1 glutathione S-transferase [Aquisalimonas asiatica]
MDLYYSLTSPYARIVRASLLEKRLADRTGYHVVDPWSDDAGLMQVNPATRVPTLVTDDGVAITESLLIVHFLEASWPDPTLVPEDRRAEILGQAGRAVGLIDAGVQTLLAKRFGPEGVDQGVLGQRRSRTITSTLDRLESQPPEAGGDLGALAVAVALQYLDFRFPELAWREQRPALSRWLERVAVRESLSATVPQ